MCDLYLSRIGECLELELVGVRVFSDVLFRGSLHLLTVDCVLERPDEGSPVGLKRRRVLGKQSQSGFEESSD